MNMLLSDIRFSIREATISGHILNPDWLNNYGKDENPGLFWSVQVQTEEQLLGGEFFVAPRISWDEVSFPLLSRWSDIEGKTVYCDAADLRSPHPYSYFETHEVIPSSTLKIGKRVGNKFRIHWEGTCDPMLEEPYDKGVPFIIQTKATFNEISVQASLSDTDTTTQERLSKYLDSDDLIQHPMKEIVRDDLAQNHNGMIDSLSRWILRSPVTRRTVQRYSIFEPRI